MTPKYIDIHSHVNFKAFDEDRDEVIKRALEAGTWVINVGTQIDTSRFALQMARQYKEGVYAIVGLHPIHTGASYHDKEELGEGGKEFTSRGEDFDSSLYEELVKDEKVVAVGECGLDYYRMDDESIERQKKAFVAQIELANKYNKPLMLHIRKHKNLSNVGEEKKHDAYLDALEILKLHAKVKGNFHFFGGTWEEAKAYIDFGFTISFTGVLTFTKDYDEVVRNAPLDMIMSETDSPYITPVPFRGKRNEPLYVKEVVKKIAEIKGITEEETAQAILANAKRVFKI